jgi:guanylate kinase
MSVQRGSLVIISSPSGAGKTTLAHKLLDEFNDVQFSVSYTTRAPRRGETDGVDYTFVSVDQFESMIEADEFAEWALVHGNRYGTSRAVVEAALAEGHDVVFDVDWQGGKRLSEQWPDDALMIFILPPHLTILKQRLRRRATDEEDVIKRRLHTAIEEIGHHDLYPHKILNDDLEEAYALLRAIYLCRKAGDATSPEHRELVEANLAAKIGDHADSLVRDGNARKSDNT